MGYEIAECHYLVLKQSFLKRSIILEVRPRNCFTCCITQRQVAPTSVRAYEVQGVGLKIYKVLGFRRHMDD